MLQSVVGALVEKVFRDVWLLRSSHVSIFSRNSEYVYAISRGLTLDGIVLGTERGGAMTM